MEFHRTRFQSSVVFIIFIWFIYQNPQITKVIRDDKLWMGVHEGIVREVDSIRGFITVKVGEEKLEVSVPASELLTEDKRAPRTKISPGGDIIETNLYLVVDTPKNIKLDKGYLPAG